MVEAHERVMAVRRAYHNKPFVSKRRAGRRKRLAGLLLAVLAAYLVAPELERILYLNEFLSLSGFFLWVRFGHIPPTDQSKRILRGVQLYIGVGCAHLAASPLIHEINVYGYLRNAQMVYSAFSFFVGVFVFDALLQGGRLTRGAYWITMGLNAVAILSLSYLSTVLLPGVMYGRGRPVILFILFLALFVSSSWSSLVDPAGSGATVFVYLSLVCVMFVIFLIPPLHRITNMLVATVLSTAVLLYVVVAPVADVLMEKDFDAYQESLNSVITVTDGNTAWRLGLWSVLLGEGGLDLLVGKGMGVSLFPVGLESRINLRSYEDPHFAYTLGAHNSFLTVLLRMGVLGLGALVWMYRGFSLTLTSFVRRWVRTGDMLRFSTALGVAAVTMHAVAHVVIESPLYATAFWGAWGIFFGALVSDPVEEPCR